MLNRLGEASRPGDPRASGGGRMAVPRARDRHPRPVPRAADRRWPSGSASPTGTATAARSARTPTSSASTTTGTCSRRPGSTRTTSARRCATTSTTSLLVVPIQTAVSLFLAVLVNRRVRFVGFFRTAFYFPSVTSSVAITILFLFLFSPTGVINKLLSYLGATGPSWLYDPRGLFHVILGQFGVAPADARSQTARLPRRQLLGLAVGPSIAMCVFILLAVFTTSGTFMLLFLAALQNIDDSVNEAAALDGATEWRKFRSHHGADDPADDLHRRDARPHRHLAGLRPDLRRDEGKPVEHDADAGVPVVQLLVQQQQLGRRRGDRLHPLRDHRLLHGRDAARARAARTASRDGAGSARRSRIGTPDASRVASAGAREQRSVRRATRVRCAGAAWGPRSDVQLPARARGHLHLSVRDRDRRRRSRRSRTRPPIRSASSRTRSTTAAFHAALQGSGLPAVGARTR